MLDQLVESRNDGQKTARGSYLLTTAFLVLSLFASGILWSLFAKDLGGNENLELTSLVAPVKMPEDAPPPPEPAKQVKPEQPQKIESDLPTRQENMARVDEPFVPNTTSTVQNTVRERPSTAFRIGTTDVDPPAGSSSNIGDGRNTSNLETGIKTGNEKPEPEETTPPPDMKKKEVPAAPQKPSGPLKVSELLNGRARNLPVPNYPAPAKAVKAAGNVSVQVTIDENGSVISANAVSGHVLLKQAAENAARGAKFSPTILNGQPIKVTGIIVYKFAMQ